jgi:hypothetical protein
LRFVSAAAGMPVRPMIAGPSDIAEAIRVYYYGEEDEEKPIAASCPPRMSTIPPPTNLSIANIRPIGASPAPLPVSDDDSGELSLSDAEILFLTEEPEDVQAISEEEVAQVLGIRTQGAKGERADEPASAADAPVEGPAGKSAGDAAEPDDDDMPSYPSRREAERYMWGLGQKEQQPGFSMTLLDGTTVAFGGATLRRADESYTKEDLLAGLRALAFDTPMDDLLPTDRWERYMAALLEVLLKKHLVLYDEFIAALKKE